VIEKIPSLAGVILDEETLLNLAIWEVIRRQSDTPYLDKEREEEEKKESIKNHREILSTLVSTLMEKLPENSDKQRKLLNEFHKINDPVTDSQEELQAITQSVLKISNEARGNLLWRSVYSLFFSSNSAGLIKAMFDENGELKPQILKKK
jgi:hypothetical protein